MAQLKTRSLNALCNDICLYLTNFHKTFWKKSCGRKDSNSEDLMSTIQPNRSSFVDCHENGCNSDEISFINLL